MIGDRTTTEILQCRLTPDEHRDRGRQLAEALENVRVFEAAQKVAKEQAKEQGEQLEKEVARLREIVRTEEEPRSVPVRLMFDEGAGMVDKIRLDTGELVHRRPMTDAEKQRLLPFQPKAVGD